MGVCFCVGSLLRFVSVQHTFNKHEISPRSRTYTGVSVSGVCVCFHVEYQMSHVFRV